MMTQILERDVEGMPKLELTPLERTVIWTQTKENFDELMRVYECGGWKWITEHLPTQLNTWRSEDTCVGAGMGIYGLGKFQFSFLHFYQWKGYNIIALQEFYEKEEITSEMLTEINEYFDRRKQKAEI